MKRQTSNDFSQKEFKISLHLNIHVGNGICTIDHYICVVVSELVLVVLLIAVL